MSKHLRNVSKKIHSFLLKLVITRLFKHFLKKFWKAFDNFTFYIVILFFISLGTNLVFTALNKYCEPQIKDI